ncbi:MAG TPA: peptidylprolyl isomerase [Candidatus Nanopelagicales bacterium]|nr:peptidylprolyl isomerase [Candidatus Nanopelagicales bacterium]
MATSNKRQRELARQKFERQQQRRLEREAAQRRRTRVVGAVTGLAVVAVALGLFWYSQRDSGSASAAPSASASPTTSVQGCTTAPTPTAKTQTWTSVPASTKPAAQITLATNCGSIVIKTLPAKAPKTVQSMSFLVDQGYYTDSDCFRLTTQGIFVFQCGSPSNDGQGGPGYKIPDENLPTSAQDGYPAGTVAMANSGANTNGSQFFLVYQDGTKLGPNYTIWGTVVSGLDVLQRVAAAGVQGGTADGKPVQPLVITKATTG